MCARDIRRYSILWVVLDKWAGRKKNDSLPPADAEPGTAEAEKTSSPWREANPAWCEISRQILCELAPARPVLTGMTPAQRIAAEKPGRRRRRTRALWHAMRLLRLLRPQRRRGHRRRRAKAGRIARRARGTGPHDHDVVRVVAARGEVAAETTRGSASGNGATADAARGPVLVLRRDGRARRRAWSDGHGGAHRAGRAVRALGVAVEARAGDVASFPAGGSACCCSASGGDTRAGKVLVAEPVASRGKHGFDLTAAEVLEAPCRGRRRLRRRCRSRGLGRVGPYSPK